MNEPSTTVELRYKEEVYAVIGAAIEVHRTLGAGFLEAVYQEAMEIEMASREVPFEPQPRIDVLYKRNLLKAHYVPDFRCFGRIIVEIKALQRLTGREVAQVLNAMKAAKAPVSVLINFGSVGKLEWQRLVI